VGGFDTVDPTAQGAASEQWLRDDMELDRLRTVVGEEIERALQRLPEVAQVVGCAVGTVKSRLRGLAPRGARHSRTTRGRDDDL
jgi:hypothetical protein